MLSFLLNNASSDSWFVWCNVLYFALFARFLSYSCLFASINNNILSILAGNFQCSQCSNITVNLEYMMNRARGGKKWKKRRANTLKRSLCDALYHIQIWILETITITNYVVCHFLLISFFVVAVVEAATTAAGFVRILYTYSSMLMLLNQNTLCKSLSDHFLLIRFWRWKHEASNFTFI